MARASEQIWALVSGLPSRERGHRLFMVFQAFIDDSGSEPQSPIFVLGGFIASHDQWAKFADEWDAALKEPPGLDYFKMSEAASLVEQFSPGKGWADRKRDDRLIALARIIRKYAKARLVATMPYDAFMKHIATIPASARTLSSDSPYPLLFMQTILAAAVMGDRHGIDSACDFIFDEQAGYSEEIVSRWPQFKEIVKRASRSDLPKLIGSPPIFRNEKEFLPLQAADMYAWQIRNHLIRNRGTILMPPSRVLGVIEPLPEISRTYTEAELIRLRDHLLKIGERFVSEFPHIPLILLSDNPTQRRKLRQRARRAAKRAASVSPSSGEQPS
jgi:hypothetical protein